MDKDKQFKENYKKLKSYYKNIDTKDGQAFEELLQQMSFCLSMLQECKEDILKNGSVIPFKQGSNEFMRENPSTGVFLRACKEFRYILREINELVGANVEVDDPLLNFIKKYND